MKQTEIEVISGGAFLGSFFVRTKNEQKVVLDITPHS